MAQWKGLVIAVASQVLAVADVFETDDECSVGQEGHAGCSLNALQLRAQRFVAAAGEATNLDWRNNLALQGYDPVSYFSGKPVPGDTSITSVFEGGVYRFSTESNKEMFESEGGAKYAPVNGGFCAFAMAAENMLVPINPLAYKIVGGKLHVFFHQGAANALVLWEKDEENLEVKRAEHWEAKTYEVLNANFQEGLVMLSGYDPVSYFSGAPAMGSKDITSKVTWADHGPAAVEYRFSTEENKALFDAEGGAAKYSPVYGSFCATGMGENKLLPADPLNYKMVDGKLHVFFKSLDMDGRAEWNKAEAKWKALAATNWENKAFGAAWANCGSPPTVLMNPMKVDSCQ